MVIASDIFHGQICLEIQIDALCNHIMSSRYDAASLRERKFIILTGDDRRAADIPLGFPSGKEHKQRDCIAHDAQSAARGHSFVLG